ncbi:MAG TPA: alkaline phosphatase family protein, partial [Gemmatimonadaceae bacterium]|nr:alkaline phosphatase family protein [Gemmatimonadaceae bacterium]
LFQQMARRLARRGRATDASPGLVVLEVDGLSHGELRAALEAGDMPTLRGWLERGSHRLMSWDCEVPSQTSSSQAGILHGHNDDIPGFRWYEKRTGRLVVSGRPGDAAMIEARIARGGGLLRAGSGFSNVFSGEAPRSVMTTSTLHGAHRRAYRYSPPFFGYYLNPYQVGRALVLLLVEVMREWMGALRQRLARRTPRVGRGGAYPLLRAMSTVVLRDMSVQLLTEELAAGVPVNYTAFVGYDVVAHYAGVASPDVRRVLRGIDGRIARLERAARRAPRPYRFCVISDHGQSPAIPFSHRHGETLEELVRRLLHAGPGAVRGSVGSDETGSHVQALLAEPLGAERAATVARRLEEGTAAAQVAARVGSDYGATAAPDAPPSGARGADVVVCASGNLGLVYFTHPLHRVTLEELEELHPGLATELVAHPGIGFVLARSRVHGPLVLGRDGSHALRSGRITGTDPLLPYGGRAAAHLRRLDGFTNVGDLVVNGRVEADGETVVGFEEHLGTHGGLGGPQTEAFLIHPEVYGPVPEPLVGAVALHALLRAWAPTATGGGMRDAGAESSGTREGGRPGSRAPA